MAMLMAMDNGKFNVKGYVKGNQIVFKNRVSPCDSDIIPNGGYIVTYKGKKYFVGNGSDGENAMEGKCESENLLTTLVAIAELTEGDEEITLVYGESANYYFNPDHHKKLKKMLVGTHTIDIFGKKKREIVIKEVLIMLEGVAHMFTDYRRRGAGTRITVDMGGTTIQVFMTTDGRPSKDESFSFPMGMYSIRSLVDEKYKKELQIFLTKAEIDQEIAKVCLRKTLQAKIDKGLTLSKDEQIDYEVSLLRDSRKIEVIETVIRGQLKELDRQLSQRKNLNLHTRDEVFFVGGTAMSIKEYINEHYNNANVLEDGLFANVKGYYAYGMVVGKNGEK